VAVARLFFLSSLVRCGCSDAVFFRAITYHSPTATANPLTIVLQPPVNYNYNYHYSNGQGSYLIEASQHASYRVDQGPGRTEFAEPP